jgi:toxin HigB-1
MIASFKSKALQRFWVKGDAKRIQPHHLAKLQIPLTVLDNASKPEDMNAPGFSFHKLSGNQAGRYAIKVDKNFRVTFGWSAPDAIDVDYEDYH